MRPGIVVILALVAGPWVWSSEQVPSTAAVSGRVMAADSNEPLAGASVRLTRVDGVGPKVSVPPVATSDNGEFSFTNLAPGRYWVTASKPRYLTLAYGQRPGSGLPGISVVVAPGGRAPELTIALPLASVISGTVLDERGEPAMGANVNANLIECTPLPSLALPVTVGAGDERAGTNMSYVGGGGLPSVSGRVLSTAGSPVANVRVTAVATGSHLRGLEAKQSYSTRTGEFNVGHLAPGPYRLIATISNSDLTAELDVVIPPTSLEGIELRPVPGGVVTGTVVGLPPTTSTAPRVALHALEATGRPAGTVTGRADGQGRFTLRGLVSGRYAVSVSDLPSGYRVAAVEQNGRDIHDLPLTVGSGQEITGITVRLAQTSTTLVGTLLDRSGAPTPDYLVVVFAEDERYWWPGTTRIVAEQPSSDGRYTFTGLPPGRYRVAVVTDAEPGEWLAPEFLEKLIPASVRLTLEVGRSVTQDLRMR